MELDVPLEYPSLLKRLIKKYITDYEIGINEMAAILALPIDDYLDFYEEY